MHALLLCESAVRVGGGEGTVLAHLLHRPDELLLAACDLLYRSHRACGGGEEEEAWTGFAGDEGQANVSFGHCCAHEGRLQYYLGRDLAAAAQAPWSHHWLDHAAWLMSLAAARQPVCVCVEARWAKGR